jgi:hypothetical protein
MLFPAEASGPDGMSGRSRKSMRLVLVVLSVALITLITDPAQAQAAADNQYGSSGVGKDAATVAITASTAFGEVPDEGAASEESSALAAEKTPPSNDPEIASVEASAETKVADSEEGVAIDSLPETGGVSPLALGVLLVAGGVLIRTLTRLALVPGN